MASHEAKFDEVFRRLDSLDGRFSSLSERVNRIDVAVGKVESRLEHMPTKVEMWAAILGTQAVAVAAVVGAMWWMFQQFLGPILSKAAGGP